MSSKFALVIANTEYQDASFTKLTAPGMDAEELAHVLREPELAAFDDVQILLNEVESKIRRSIARFFVDRKRDDLLLLYFSGHGIRNEQGQLFLAANDTEINILEASGIPAEFVTQSMNNSRSQRQLLILDCCNSGAFAHGTKSAGAVGKSMGIASAFEGSGFGRVVLTATDATQYAWEGDKVIGDTQKSVFTHFLIEGLKGEADRDGDGRIHVDELYDYAYEQVVRRTPKQTPGKWSYKQQGDIILRENLQPREVKPAPLPTDLLELLSHPNSSVRKVGIQDLVSLLNGKHLGLARGAEEKLREIAENDDSFSFRRTASEALTARGLIVETPAPVEIPKEKQKEEKHALTTERRVEGNIEKPISVPPREIRSPRVDKLREKTPRVLPDWKRIASRFNLRVILGIGALLVVVSLGIAVFPALKSMIAPEIGSTRIGEDGMTLLYVPAGEFTMGNENDSDDEKPAHTVTLDAFWIDKSEVTNKMYTSCVEAGVCEEPTNTSSYTHSSYYGNSEFDDYPVIYVNWNMAKTYCEWADRRLPTEAEWEKAARWNPPLLVGEGGGEGEAFTYPWGNTFDGTLVNFCDTNCSFDWADKSSDDGFADVAPVGSYPNGASPYGAYDMAGNVWEWVADWYNETYYASSPASNPLGPDSGQSRALRGGSWNYINYEVRSARRSWGGPSNSDLNLGFRCAVSDDEQAGSTPLAQVGTNTPQPIATDTPSSSEASISPTPALGIGSTMNGEDGMTMLYVPAGEFTMGSNDGSDDEKPVHTVTLDAFWIDKSEVTNKMYAACVEAGVCEEPTDLSSFTHFSYYGNAQFEDYPVLYMDWNMAKTYCEWADRRLPTEAEWEKAARGEDANVYPWGNETPNNELVNYGSAVGDTTEVGTYPDGASVYGALDMAGNVWEWVADWYDASYYSNSPSSNPLGSDSGIFRVLRGGSWDSSGNGARSALRFAVDPNGMLNNFGFRCALSADEQAQVSTSQPSATEASTPAPTLGIGSTITGEDGMTLLYVPAGEFTMGYDGYEFDRAQPVHTVFLDAFWIDQTEVTNGMYARCVNAGVCKEPSRTSKTALTTQNNLYGKPESDNYPVTYVSWNDVNTYCSWVGRRLPTEAEWEKAARGTDGRIYPWGNAEPDNNLLNYNQFVEDTTEVGSYPDGASPYGVLDMAGNVSEWVSDWFRYDYYEDSPLSNPVGPDSGEDRVVRGSSYYDNGVAVRSEFRGSHSPSNRYGFDIGFRCAMDATP